MTKKNTQAAFTPLKEPRQYKHTPNKTKRIVGKIFALVGCLAVLLSCVVVPCFADVVQPDTVGAPFLTAHPYAPQTFTYAGEQSIFGSFERAVTLDYSWYLAGNRSSYACNKSFWLGNSSYTDYQTTSYLAGLSTDTNHKGSLYYQPNSTLANSANLSYCRFIWGSFTNTENTDLVYAPEVTLNYTDATYLQFYFTVTDINGNVYERNISSEYGESHSIRPIDTIKQLLAIDEFNVASMVMGCVPKYDYEGTENNADVLLTDVTVYYSFSLGATVTSLIPPSSMIEVPVPVIPDAIEPSGLFSWLADALNGVLSAPLIPIGNYSITIGSIVGMLLGISLVIAFLKFFAGG